MKEEHFLIGDISGTNITLGIAKFANDIHKIIFKKKYLTKDFDGLCEVTTKFFDEISNLSSNMNSINVENAVFGVASKIPENFDMIFHLTNSPFVIERNKLIETTSIKNATYINDFESLGYSVLDIDTNKLLEINEGLSKKIDYPIITVIGAGTGLGKVKLAYDSTLKKYVDVPSESGHISLIIEGEEELRLVRFILKKRGIEEVEFEDILSGRGIENIYSFITRKDISAKQISFLKNNNDENAKRTFEMFYRFYARFANIMVQKDSSNIIYLVGGIIAKNINFSKEDFMAEFLRNNKTNNKQDLKDTSIYAITDYDISLNGVCMYIKLNLFDN